MGSVLGSFGAFQGNIWSVAPFIPEGDQKEPKISILPYWIFLMVVRSGFFPDGLLTPKTHFGAIRANLKMVFLRKIHFFAYPIWAQNGLFFYPSGSQLTQNLKNIVVQVVLTQNIAFQGFNWSPNNNGNFGVRRPPQT